MPYSKAPAFHPPQYDNNSKQILDMQKAGVIPYQLHTLNCNNFQLSNFSDSNTSSSQANSFTAAVPFDTLNSKSDEDSDWKSESFSDQINTKHVTAPPQNQIFKNIQTLESKIKHKKLNSIFGKNLKNPYAFETQGSLLNKPKIIENSKPIFLNKKNEKPGSFYVNHTLNFPPLMSFDQHKIQKKILNKNQQVENVFELSCQLNGSAKQKISKPLAPNQKKISKSVNEFEIENNKSIKQDQKIPSFILKGDNLLKKLKRTESQSSISIYSCQPIHITQQQFNNNLNKLKVNNQIHGLSKPLKPSKPSQIQKSPLVKNEDFQNDSKVVDLIKLNQKATSQQTYFLKQSPKLEKQTISTLPSQAVGSQHQKTMLSQDEKIELQILRSKVKNLESMNNNYLQIINNLSEAVKNITAVQLGAKNSPQKHLKNQKYSKYSSKNINSSSRSYLSEQQEISYETKKKNSCKFQEQNPKAKKNIKDLFS